MKFTERSSQVGFKRRLWLSQATDLPRAPSDLKNVSFSLSIFSTLFHTCKQIVVLNYVSDSSYLLEKEEHSSYARGGY